MAAARRFSWIAIWIAIVVGGCAMHKPHEIAGAIVVVVLAPALGWLKGPKAVLTAAAAILVLSGVLALATRADRREPGLPTCPTLMDGSSYYDADYKCSESPSDQILRGFLPAAVVLLFGLTTGVLRWTADHSDREAERRSREPLQ